MGIGAREAAGSGSGRAITEDYLRRESLSSTLYYKVNGLFGLAVPPPQRVPADGKHVDEHLNAVAHHVDFSGRRMRPAHRNFRRLQSVVPGQIQQLWIETETLDALLLKKNPAALPAERFEPALGVHKRQPQNDAHDAVKNNSGEFPERGFVHVNQCAIHGSPTDSAIILLQCLTQLVGF